MTDRHVQVKLRKDGGLANLNIPDYPLSVPSTSSRDELNAVVCQLIADGESASASSVRFDFLLQGKLLRQPLGKAIEEQGLSGEVAVEVVCVLATDAPVPELSTRLPDWVSGVASFAEGGGFVTACYDCGVRCHDDDGTGSAVAEMFTHAEPVRCVAVLPQPGGVTAGSSFVTGSHDQHVILWKFEGGKLEPQMVCKGHERSVESVSCGPDGDKFISGSFDTHLKLWSVTRPAERSGEPPNGPSPSRKRPRTASARPLPSQTPLLTLAGHGGAVTCVVWRGARDEAWSCSMDHTIKLWDLELAGPKTSLPGTGAFTAIDYSPLSGAVVSASADPHVRLWDPRAKEPQLVATTFRSHKGWVSSVRWSPASEFLFVSGSYDQQVFMWDTRSPKSPLFELQGHNDKVVSVCWDVAPRVLSGGADSVVNVFKC